MSGGINSDQHLGTEEEDKRRRGGGGGGLRKIRLVVMYVCMCSTPLAQNLA